METYDPAKIGTRIAWGRSHSVYHYGDDEVIRFPRAERWLEWLLRDGLNLRDRFTRDISVCEQYLGNYVLTTRMVESSKGEIATIQPYITGHYLSKNDLQNEAIKTQFQDVVTRYETMFAAGYLVDLIGQGGVLQRRGIPRVFDQNQSHAGRMARQRHHPIRPAHRSHLVHCCGYRDAGSACRIDKLIY